MKKTNLLVVSMLALCLVGCKSPSLLSSSEFYTAEPKVSAYAMPVVADLNVASEPITYSEQIQLETSSSNALKESIAENEKNNVLARALRKYNAQIMVAPSFDVDYMESAMVITVTGFPATFKNWRNATAQDEAILKINVPDSSTPCATSSGHRSLIKL